MRDRNGPRVYSTQFGELCPNCNKPLSGCECRTATDEVVGDGRVRIGRETKGRKGKGVTTVSGIPLSQSELSKLAKKLKQKCGSGGSIRDGVIEIQGDHRERLADELKKLGYNVR